MDLLARLAESIDRARDRRTRIHIAVNPAGMSEEDFRDSILKAMRQAHEPPAHWTDPDPEPAELHAVIRCSLCPFEFDSPVSEARSRLQDHHRDAHDAREV